MVDFRPWTPLPLLGKLLCVLLVVVVCNATCLRQIESHEIHRGKGLEERLSLALALSTIQVIDGGTTDFHLHNLGRELKGREIFSYPLHS
ncbi:hypothetical protein TNCV_534771 [Trichonephila clavipes]|nr:hypothetical protein TNCV_534771 [Trichonephila clavipes]